MQINTSTTREHFEMWSPGTRLAAMKYAVTERNRLVEEAKKLGGPADKLHRSEYNDEWEDMPAAEQYAAYQDQIIDIANLAGFVQRGGQLPAVKLQVTGYTATVAA